MQKIFRDIKNRQLNLETFKKALDKNPKMIDWVATAPPKHEAGMSLLQMATRYCCFDIANYLIDRGIDVNYMPPDNGLPMTECWTPLVFQKHFLVVGKAKQVGEHPIPGSIAQVLCAFCSLI